MKKNKFLRKRAIFSVKINFNRKYQERYGDELTSDKTYWLKKQENVSYSDIKSFVEEIISKELVNEYKEFVDLPIHSIQINRTYEGSIEVFFSVLFNAYQFIAGYKGFFDSLKMIKTATSKHIEKRLREKYGDYFNVDTYLETPQDNYRDMEHFFMKRGYFPFVENLTEKRDGFFYYLLVSNIVLLIVIILLVARAVIQFYG